MAAADFPMAIAACNNNLLLQCEGMAAFRPSHEDDYTRESLALAIARLRSDATILDRFLSFAEKEGAVDRARFLPRLRVIFSGRAAPAFIALLIQKFFSTHAYLGVEREVVAGVEFRAPREHMVALKRFAFTHPGMDSITSWSMVPEQQMFSGCLYAIAHKPSADPEAAEAAGLPANHIRARKMRTQAEQWWHEALNTWPDTHELLGEPSSVFYQSAAAHDPLDPFNPAEDSLDETEERSCELYQACGLVDAVVQGEEFRIFSTSIGTWDVAEGNVAPGISAAVIRKAVRAQWTKESDVALRCLLVASARSELPPTLRTLLRSLLKTLAPRYRRLARGLDEMMLYAEADTINKAPPLKRAELLLARNNIIREVAAFCTEHIEDIVTTFAELLEKNTHGADSGVIFSCSRPRYVTPAIDVPLPEVTDAELVQFLTDCSYCGDVFALDIIKTELERKRDASAEQRLIAAVIEKAEAAGDFELAGRLTPTGAYTVTGELLAVLQARFDARAVLTSITDYGQLRVRPKGGRGGWRVFDVKLGKTVREDWDEEGPEINLRIRRYAAVLRRSKR